VSWFSQAENRLKVARAALDDLRATRPRDPRAETHIADAIEALGQAVECLYWQAWDNR
jgi:hypothetical protein